jgi:hypothetical protein
VSDGRFGGRVYRFRLENVGGALTVEPIDIIPLEIPSGAVESDQEGLAVLSNGDMCPGSHGPVDARRAWKR